MTQDDLARALIEQLKEANGTLQKLSQGHWSSINHTDPEALAKGITTQQALNTQSAAFTQLSSELSALLRGMITLPEGVEQVGLSADVTYRKPCGFEIAGHHSEEVSTWRGLYTGLCERFYQAHPHVFQERARLNMEGFSQVSDEMHTPHQLDEHVWVEAHGSANALLARLRELLQALDLPVEGVVYLKPARRA